MRTVALLIALIAAACGPSSAAVKEAHEARYTPPASALFAEVQAAVEAEYQIAQRDPAEPALITSEKWFNPEGGEEASGAGDSVNADDGGIRLALVVKLIEADGQVTVEVKPIVHRVHTGQTQLEEIPPGDARMPGWVDGRVDSLYLAIHARLKGHAATP